MYMGNANRKYVEGLNRKILVPLDSTVVVFRTFGTMYE